ncbi:MAG: DUF4296 domain-containing protein [Candidatus Cardinium sp.]|uniref:DUF4296 domain-containing protein n=1 Tax=Cardinium endosymbiont of Dermatophagoides farinae TaxID=2597823 RepID=UPI001181E92D|nr:DUF4296 domain-containing protein [Cardinium endosymbiont of Dermatophagoides farinae]TSJ80807.1 DUF4296 domain-containing protein [Cardinium endosymbiont of Dermatophagoides farinae]UWW96811.1 MAG: DUF4296 domain-containing protein [Candidatus Cardinium sp.]
MKKIAAIFLASSLLLYWVGKPTLTRIFTDHRPTTIINEVAFVHVVRDLELLNSWLLNSYYPQETIDRLRHQNHQKILTLHGVDQQAFKASVNYYLENSLDRAVKVYDKVYVALEGLSA